MWVRGRSPRPPDHRFVVDAKPMRVLSKTDRDACFAMLRTLAEEVGYGGKHFERIIADHIVRPLRAKRPTPTFAPRVEALLWLARDVEHDAARRRGAERLYGDADFLRRRTEEEDNEDPTDDEERARVAAVVHLLQRYALAVLYFSTGGVDDRWTLCSRTGPCPGETPDRLSRFLSHAEDECLWYGVTCESGAQDPSSYSHNEGRIMMLDLTNNGLVVPGVAEDESGGDGGGLPKELLLISGRLESLWLSDNPGLAGGRVPPWIGVFRRLRSLALANTGIGGTLPDGLYDLPLLEALRLHGCRLEGELRARRDTWPRLRWLWIHENPRLRGDLRPLSERGESGDDDGLEGLSVYGSPGLEGAQTRRACARSVANGGPLQHLWTDCDDDDEVGEVVVDAPRRRRCRCCTVCYSRTASAALVANERSS